MNKIDHPVGPPSAPRRAEQQHAHQNALAVAKGLNLPANDKLALNHRATISMNIVYQSISSKFSSSQNVFGRDINITPESTTSGFDYEKVAETVMAFVSSSLLMAKNNGATDEELDSIFKQVRSGVNQGIDEAIGELKELALADDDLLLGIEKSRSLIAENIDSLYQQYFPTQDKGEPPSLDASSIASAKTAASEINRLALGTNTSNLSIITADGDVVNISFSSRQEQLSAERSQFSADENQHNVSYQLTTATSREVNFSYSVEGKLDEQEIEAISLLIKDVTKLQKEFFTGDIEKAYEKALSLGFDNKELASISLDLKQTQTSVVSKKYHEIATLGDEKAPKFSKEIKPVVDFIKKLEQLEQKTNEIFGIDRKHFNKLLDAVFIAEYGQMPKALNQFNQFIQKMA